MILPDYSKSVIISENGSVSAQAYNRIYYGDWEALVSQSTQTSDTSYTIRFSLSKPNVNNSYLAGSTINISDFYLTDSNGKKIDYSSDSWHYSVVVSEGLTVNNFNVTINKKVAEGDFNITVKLTNKNNINIDTDSDVQTTVKIHVVPLPTTELFRKNERVYTVNGNAVKGYIWPQSYVEDDWQFDYNVPDGYYYDGGNPSILYQITGLNISGGDIKARTLATLLSWGRAGIKRVNEVTDSGASSGSAVASQAKQNSPAGWTEEPQQTVTKKIKVKKAS